MFEDGFAEPVQPIDQRRAAEALIVDVAGFEGPLDLLLTLSRTQKVDLREISILALAEQYLVFVETARDLRIELAADYLVMAAWLAYLKSRLLLPPEPDEDGVTADDLAAHLAFQLERLDAMRQAAARLMARDRLGQDRFPRGVEELGGRRKIIQYDAGLLDLLQAYARIRTKDAFRPLVFDREAVLTTEQALDRMKGLIRFAGTWTDLSRYLPEQWIADPARRRSAVASHFAAALELVKSGDIELKQSDTFAPIHLRKRSDPNPNVG